MGVRRLSELTSPAFAALVEDERPLVALLSVGSVEPHGPHLPLGTDTTISDGAIERAAARLEDAGRLVVIAPPVPYGVTDCAAGFAGAVSVSAEALTAYLVAVSQGLLAAGVDHVCLVNNHLEPAHDKAVRAAAGPGVSVACPLTRRWARTLSLEFKKGECHAGRYETAIVMAQAADLVDNEARLLLPEVPISLATGLMAGKNTFIEMGLDQAYAGAPALASRDEGEELLARLAEMVVAEVLEHGIASP